MIREIDRTKGTEMELTPAVKESLLTIRDLIEFLTSDENYDAGYIIEMSQEMINDLINEEPKEIEYYIAHYSRYSADEIHAKVTEFNTEWR